MPYDPSQKPDPSVCPQHFCFCWRMGIVVSAKTSEPRSLAEGCRTPLGGCARLEPGSRYPDSYEGHGPNLERAGLPWFYFYPSPDKLTPQVRERYIAESEALWGKEHWKSKDTE